MRSLLEPTKYFVLLALSVEPAYGTAIQRQVIGDTLGLYLRDSTVYDVLRDLVNGGLIERINLEGYRKLYRLTDKGYQALEQESRTWRRVVRLSQERLRWK